VEHRQRGRHAVDDSVRWGHHCVPVQSRRRSAESQTPASLPGRPLAEVDDDASINAESPTVVSGALVATRAEQRPLAALVVDLLLECTRPGLLAPVAALVGAQDVNRLR
jgi:hypothetical protein